MKLESQKEKCCARRNFSVGSAIAKLHTRMRRCFKHDDEPDKRDWEGKLKRAAAQSAPLDT